MRKEKGGMILVADDDENMSFLILKVCEMMEIKNEFRWVRDGEELTDYLFRRKKYTDPEEYPLPSLLVIDLNMPKKDGREALREIKASPQLQHIPVAIFSLSGMEKDISTAYELGAETYIQKPVGFQDFKEAVLKLVDLADSTWIRINAD